MKNKEAGIKKGEKVRVTLDLSPSFYRRLEDLEKLVEAGSKASLLRQALQLYEYVAKRTLEGCDVVVIDKDGNKEKLVLLEFS